MYSPQKQLIFRVLRHVDKISARIKHTMISYSSEEALLGYLRPLYQTESGRIPEVGFGLETHSQSFLLRHDEHSRGAIGLRTKTNK